VATPQQAKYNFQKIVNKGFEAGFDYSKNPKSAREWFREEAFKVREMPVPKFQRSATPFQNMENLSPNSIGKMYLFQYDPKWKEELPYYDTFPLIFPFSFESDRMLGINMHYLPYGARAKLMDALYTTLNNNYYNKSTKLKISYEILKGASQFKLFEPCIHCYLFSHVRSPFMYIKPELWDYTIFLPLARFKKKSQDYVWLQSQFSVNK
jgi:hypothetical protein